MFGIGQRSLYLVKASDDLVSWCDCEDAPIGLPRQKACPWCGCGWLFNCIHCGKAFTFAKAVLLNRSLERIAKMQVPIVDRVMTLKGEMLERPVARTTADWCALMRPLLAGIELGRTYVYFDGLLVPRDAPEVRARGKRRSHDLSFVPQVKALSDPLIDQKLLSSSAYWTEQDPS